MRHWKEKLKYKVMFTEYPDVVGVDQMCQMLGGIGCKTAYQLLREQKIKSFMVGRRYCIPKIHIMKYLEMIEKSGA